MEFGLSCTKNRTNVE